MVKKKTSRLDQLLLERGLARDLAHATAMILAGEIRIDGQVLRQAGMLVPENAALECAQKARFVSRGGEKLSGALTAFGLRVDGRFCLDIGSSTGGFTDCLLQNGAKCVWAIDVGHGLLDTKLRSDPRVVVMEKLNFRHFDAATLPQPADFITVDVSFIALEKIFPKMRDVLSPTGDIVAMVKPQFEGTPAQVPGGFIKDEATRNAIIEKVRQDAKTAGFTIHHAADSVLAGRKGNQEYFLHLKP